MAFLVELMYRRKTVEAIIRQHARDQAALLTIISEQNDRLMVLAGRKYAPTPLDLHVWPDQVEFEDEEESHADPSQLPDEQPADAY